MTSEKELRQIAAYEVGAACINTEIGILKLDYPELDDYELCRVHHLIVNWPIPDLPPSYHANCPAWNRHGMRITPGEDSGDVLLEWGENDNDMPVTLNLASSQVQGIIAAHYHREDQE